MSRIVTACVLCLALSACAGGGGGGGKSNSGGTLHSAEDPNSTYRASYASLTPEFDAMRQRDIPDSAHPIPAPGTLAALLAVGAAGALVIWLRARRARNKRLR